MTNKEKELLLKDLCARLPYGLLCQTDDGKGKLISVECSRGEDLVYVDFRHPQVEEYDLNEGDVVKPYLRPMSTMTEEEKVEYNLAADRDLDRMADKVGRKLQGDEKLDETLTPYYEHIDWLNKKMFDYRGLIPMGLALEAPEGMYETK